MNANKFKSRLVSTKVFKSLLSKYAMLTKRSIIIVLKDKTIYTQKNGSIIETVGSIGENCRGNRSKSISYHYDEFEMVDKEYLTKVLSPFIKVQKGEIKNDK